ncbi:thymidylate synthase [Shinella sp.]|uniref:thymidylate synthase n=1 Tax=Shinella sp. TaxID=1870904 RepID=UPI003F7288F9
MTSIYRNISFAAAASFEEVLTFGKNVVVRGSETKELLNQLTVIERPQDRFLFLPDRLNDCCAQIAESLWVLAGRSDIKWLTHYLPRAPEFSDDGATWRAGYGPRLRDWRGETDQLAQVLALLQADPTSRRAVMALFDPQDDFADSKDIPCNNLLSWLIRDGKLHLNVTIRSNDAMWGFSGANAFEWSVLHELMAHWLDVEVGRVTFFAGSFHLYRKHFDRAARIASKFVGRTPYECGVPALPIAIRWTDLSEDLRVWFELEATIRQNPSSSIDDLQKPNDLFLRSSLEVIRLYWLDKQPVADVPDRVFSEILAKMPESDLVAAAYEFFGRRRPSLLQHIPHPNIAGYFASRVAYPTDQMDVAIKRLHSTKDRAYGGAWKKRGEVISVLSNIARKVDRLEVYRSSRHELVDETILDTAVDLFVYTVKYRLFLEDVLPADLLDPSASRPFADHEANFDTQVDRLFANDLSASADSDLLIQRVSDCFERLWPLASAGGTITEKKAFATELSETALQLVHAIRRDHPIQAVTFIRAALAQDR